MQAYPVQTTVHILCAGFPASRFKGACGFATDVLKGCGELGLVGAFFARPIAQFLVATKCGFRMNLCYLGITYPHKTASETCAV